MFPSERIRYLLNTLQPKFIIVEDIFCSKISKIYNNKITKILIIDKKIKNNKFFTRLDVLKKNNTKPLLNNICTSDLAYIIFTSWIYGETQRSDGDS